MSARAEHDAPYWCEENVWHLCADPQLGQGAREVAIVTNENRRVALFHQRASTRTDGLVVWDYHALVFAEREDGWLAWDLDTTLGWPVPALAYLERTFPPALDSTWQPRFRIVAGPVYRTAFGSDRRHMRAPDGSWLQPPPSWPVIGPAHLLPRLLDTSDATDGPWLDVDTLRRRYGDKLRP